MKVLLFPVKIYKFEMFNRVTPGSSLVLYIYVFPLGSKSKGCKERVSILFCFVLCRILEEVAGPPAPLFQATILPTCLK